MVGEYFSHAENNEAPFFLYVPAARLEVQINKGLDWGYQKSLIIKILAFNQ